MATARARAGAACLIGLLLPAGVAAAEGIGPGSYCPLPEKGEVPVCLAPAEDAYAEFFTAVDRGDAGDVALAKLETAVAQGGQADGAYLALTSLTHGYYRLARRAAASESVDPEIAARLERWNELLARAYSRDPDDASYRDAVRRSAEDLHARAPVRLACADAQGEPVACSSTESVLRGIDAAGDRVGIRGALERLLARMLESDS